LAIDPGGKYQTVRNSRGKALWKESYPLPSLPCPSTPYAQAPRGAPSAAALSHFAHFFISPIFQAEHAPRGCLGLSRATKGVLAQGGEGTFFLSSCFPPTRRADIINQPPTILLKCFLFLLDSSTSLRNCCQRNLVKRWFLPSVSFFFRLKSSHLTISPEKGARRSLLVVLDDDHVYSHPRAHDS